MVRAIFESRKGSHFEEVAIFNSEAIYDICEPVLSTLAESQDMVLIGNVSDETEDEVINKITEGIIKQIGSLIKGE